MGRNRSATGRTSRRVRAAASGAQNASTVASSHFTDTDRAAISLYVNEVYGYLANQQLRTGESTGAAFGVSDAALNQFINQLDTAMHHAHTETALDVLRGASFDTAIQNTGLTRAQILADPSKLVGTTLTEKGYMSVTTDEHEAAVYSAQEMMYHIKLPKGTHAINPNAAGVDMADSWELIVARNAKMKVTKAEKRNGVVHIWVDLKQR